MKQTLKIRPGKYVISRSSNAGVIFGKITNMGDGFIELKNARRIWRPISNDKSLSWYEGVAVSGLCPEKGVISGKVRYKLIVEAYEVTSCSKSAIKKLKTHKSNETTY